MSLPQVDRLLARRRAGWSLEQAFYVDDDVFAYEMDVIFGHEWLFVGHTCEVREPGDWFRVDIGRDSIVVVRGTDDALRAFHNTCRHRGSRICIDERGQDRRLTCPYHQWSYDLSGRLVGTRFMGDDFDAARFPLAPVAVETVAGYVFISLADQPSDFSTFRAVVGDYLAPHRLEDVKVVATQTLIDNANWKLVMENNRECYHCAGGHPELMQIVSRFEDHDDPHATPDYAAVADRKRADWDELGLRYDHTREGGLTWRAVRIPLANGAVSMTIDGRPACTRLLGELTDRDLGSARFYLMPNTWNHVCSDHVVSFRVLPIRPFETEVTTKWLVHRDAVEGVDYDPERIQQVWAATNDQDRVLCERNMAGIMSRAYRPGPYSPVIERGTVDFVDWYAATMASAGPRSRGLEEVVAVRAVEPGDIWGVKPSGVGRRSRPALG